MEPLISHGDITTIMRVLADIREDVNGILKLLEDEDGEEEAHEENA